MRTERVWHHFDAAMKKADEAFAEADKAFAEMDRLFEGVEETEMNTTGTVHRLRFQAETWKDRWRLSCHFLKLACLALWCGKVSFQFKRRK